MDIFNDLYPICPENPETLNLSDQEEQERQQFVNLGKKRKRLTFDDYCTVYSDELWHLWCLIDDFKKDNKPILNCLDFPTFCSVCYENTNR
jgi:hypothetical protein